MASDKLTDLYTGRKRSFQDRASLVQRQTLFISWIRVVLVLLILVLAYFSFTIVWLWFLTAVTIIVYARLVIYHGRLNYQKTFLQNLVVINEGEMKALQGDYDAFVDGTEFVDGNHPYAVDLDIFSKGSLFQRINRTSTEFGRERLAEILKTPLASAEAIRQRQDAVREVSERLDFRQNFQAIGMTSHEKKEDLKQLLSWLDLPALVYGKRLYQVLLVVFPVLFLTTLLYSIITGVMGPFIIIALVQWGIIGSHAKKVTLFQDYIGSKRYLLEKFADHFRLLQQENFKTAIFSGLALQSKEAQQQLSVLASRSRALDLRLNMFSMLFLNSTVLYDLLCVYRLEQWREQNRQHLAQWLQAIREADALNSLGGYAFNHPDFVFPEITEKEEFYAEQLGHPLIKAGRVNNDVTVEGPSIVWLVTGANMAGKSTFLRTVGVNTVLALTGQVVCAAKMRCPLVEIYSGMRNTDSINDNQSYFFAELLRLQKIITHLREGKKLLILLDEILKGTNSIDKLTGSEELIKQLITQPCFALVATHDTALGEMEKQYSQVKNYHFETFINGNELYFDYKLKTGVSTGKNATFLMKKMGIIA